MAIFNWHIESYRKGSATSQSDYLWRRNHFNVRDDLVATGCGNLPTWCDGDPARFFAASDTYERKNGSACRHLVVSLPREFNRTDWIGLVDNLIARDLQGKPYQYAIHSDPNRDDEHPHAHILYSDRVSDGIDRPAETFFLRPNAKNPALGGCRKDSGGHPPKQLKIGVINRKKLWAEIQNQALKEAGHAARVDYRSCQSKDLSREG